MLNKVVTVILGSFLLISCGGGGSSGGGANSSKISNTTSAANLSSSIGSSSSISSATQSSSIESSSSVSNSSIQNSSAESSSSTPTQVFPVANAGADQSVKGGHPVLLDGTASHGEAGSNLSYTWTAPDESGVFFLDESGVLTRDAHTRKLKVYIPANQAGKTLTFSLVVSDGTRTSEADTVNVTVDNCVSDEGNVFLDCLDPFWSSISSWQTIPGRADNTYYADGVDNHITWSIIDLQDDEHNQVIDVKFHRSDANGSFSLNAPVPTGADMPAKDMTAFANGYLKFDVRNAGDNNPLTLFVDVQCGNDCTTTDAQIIPTNANKEWTSVSIRIQDLVSLGLDLSKVSTAILINPTWNDQANVSFQLDNIRWEKAGCYDAVNVVYSNCLERTDRHPSGWDATDNIYNTTNSTKHVRWTELFSGEAGYGNVIEVSFNKTNQASTFSINPSATLNLSEYAQGELVFDYKIVSLPHQNTDLFAVIQCSWPCQSDLFLLDKSTLGKWVQKRIPVAELVSSGLDLTKASAWFSLTPTENQPQSNIVVRLDNIRWEK